MKRSRKPFIVWIAYAMVTVAIIGLAVGGLQMTSPFVAYADAEQISAMTIPADLDQVSIRSYRYWSDDEWLFSHNSLPDKDYERLQRTGFSDALTMPFTNWPDGFNFYGGYDSLREEIYEEIRTNPIFAYAVAKYLYDKPLRTGKTLGEINDAWMGEFIRNTEYHVNVVGDGWNYIIHWSYFYSNEVALNDEYKVFAVQLMMLLDNFTVIGIDENCNAYESWTLVEPNESAKLRLPKQCSFYDPLPGFILAYERKDSFASRYFGGHGTYDCFIGFNKFDKRPLNPDEPTPETTPEPTPTYTCPPRPTPTQTCRPTPTPTPEPTPTPTSKPTPTPTPKPTPTPHPTKDPDDRPQPSEAPIGGGPVEPGNDEDDPQPTPPPRSTPVPSTPDPTPKPTEKPTPKPTEAPTPKPTPKPTEAPPPKPTPPPLETKKPEVTKRPEIRDDPPVEERVEIPDDD